MGSPGIQQVIFVRTGPRMNISDNKLVFVLLVCLTYGAAIFNCFFLALILGQGLLQITQSICGFIIIIIIIVIIYCVSVFTFELY